MSTLTRRTFLMTTGAAVAGASLSRRARAVGASERVRFGLIGCGVRGRSFGSLATSLCDPDQTRLGQLAGSAGIASGRTMTDLRRMLDDPAIDAVIIATPDHWHAPAAILACEAGKHVYVEKPVSHNFRESRLLLRAAQRANVVVQHGTQQRSRPFVRDAIAMLHEGAIGEVLAAKAWNVQLRDSIGKRHASPPPREIDYDTWVGPAEWMPHQSNRLHSAWHWWHNFGTGDIGNDGAHELDYARWGLGVDALPCKVSATGGKYFFDDDQQFPDTATCAFEYAPANQGATPRQLSFEMRLWSRNYPMNCDSGVEFYGTKGRMFLSKRGKLQVVGPQNEKILDSRPGEENALAHIDNFVAAIRGEAPLNAPLIEAHRSVALAHLANAAIRVGRSLQFDAVAEQVVGDDDASRLMQRVYRKGGHWATPVGMQPA
ncbi:1,5-anhydro-D-fructose reductase [Pirellulimonas nuda]|uniref:1,5-anhydro-D-fructose reductase n=1 Tax=Pirellulimonas nuda TaxID=2528009 RepID=A0A518DG43_9BACT|nr:Gfo/Idh/MocA family oxidoreductase [Pirellulimonas nuda]QDU90438.1 1,5-anhydro-D-fructose reductase [Pirellulimonas nuda]